MSFRDQLVTSIIDSLRPAVERAVNEVLGVGTPAQSPPPKARRAPRTATTAARTPRPVKSARGPVDSYNAGDPKARRLPNFVRTLLGGEPSKKDILAKYGPHFTFTAKTTKDETEAAAKAWQANKASPPASDSVEATPAPKKEAARRLSVKASSPIVRRKKAAR